MMGGKRNKTSRFSFPSVFHPPSQASTMTSQGIPEDLKQQLAKKEAEKEQKGREIKELVAKREGLESELRKAKPEERQDIEAAIKNVKEDIDSLRGEIPALNDQIKFLLG